MGLRLADVVVAVRDGRKHISPQVSEAAQVFKLGRVERPLAFLGSIQNAHDDVLHGLDVIPPALHHLRHLVELLKHVQGVEDGGPVLFGALAFGDERHSLTHGSDAGGLVVLAQVGDALDG